MGGSSGALGGGTSTLHPLDPWHVLKLYFLDVSMLLAFGLPTRPLLGESDPLEKAEEEPNFICGPPLLC